jgi:hypothetical protein
VCVCVCVCVCARQFSQSLKFNDSFFHTLPVVSYTIPGARGSLVEALCYKPDGRWLESR